MITKIKEDELIALLKMKDKDAFLYAYDLFSSPLFGVVTKMVKDNSLAEVVLKKSFERMWEQLGTLVNYNGRIFIWMHNITRNVAMEELNKVIRTNVMQQRYIKFSGHLA